MRKRRTPSWKTEKFTGRHYRPYVAAIGQLALAWNAFHEDLALLFIELLANGRAYPATDIWNSANYDRPKREMLRAVVKTNWSSHSQYSKLAADVEWLLNVADSLEDARNDAVHSPLIFYGRESQLAVIAGYADRVMPSIAHGNKRAMKLGKKDLLSEFRWCRDCAVVLGDFAAALYLAVASRTPWPDRPSLPNRGQKKRRPAGPRRPSEK